MADLNKLPYLSYNLIDLQPYFSNYAKRFGFTTFCKAAPIYSQKGCLWKERTGGCIFCGAGGHYRSKNPQYVWKEIESILDDCEVNIIYDVANDIISDKYWLGEFANSKPAHVNCAFFLYGRIDQVNLETARLLRGINCYEILAGIESGNARCLKALRKGFKPENVLIGSKILHNFGIKLFPCFVLGAPGETEKSALNTLELAQELVNIGNIYEISCSTLLPIPGSPAFNMMLRIPSLGEKYKGQDVLSPEDLRKDWVKHFSNVAYDFLLEITERILDLVPIKNNFASLMPCSKEKKMGHISGYVVATTH